MTEMAKLWQDVCLTFLFCLLLPTLLNAQGSPATEEIPVPAKCQFNALLLHVGTDDGSTKTTFQCRCNNIEYNPFEDDYFIWHYQIPSQGFYPYMEMRFFYRPLQIFKGVDYNSHFALGMFRGGSELALMVWEKGRFASRPLPETSYQIIDIQMNTTNKHAEHDHLVNIIDRRYPLRNMPDVLLNHLIATNFSVFPKQLSFEFIFTFVEPPLSTPSVV